MVRSCCPLHLTLKRVSCPARVLDTPRLREVHASLSPTSARCARETNLSSVQNLQNLKTHYNQHITVRYDIISNPKPYQTNLINQHGFLTLLKWHDMAIPGNSLPSYGQSPPGNDMRLAKLMAIPHTGVISATTLTLARSPSRFRGTCCQPWSSELGTSTPPKKRLVYIYILKSIKRT